jgi:peptidyl-prolyl cis-trans isomerase C
MKIEARESQKRSHKFCGKEFYMHFLFRVSLMVCSFALVFSTTFAQEEATTNEVTGADPVVLRVNGEEMLLSEFNERFTFYANNLAAQQGMQLTPEMAPMFDSLKPQYLEQLASEKVLLQEGIKRGLSVEETVVDEQIEQIKTNFASDEEYMTALTAAGLSSEDLLRQLIAESELSRRTVEALRTSIQLRPYQLQLYYDQNKAQYGTPAEACARHILVETEEEARAVEADLAAGTSFEEEAAAKSIDPGSAANGGDLGCFPQGAMIPVFEEAAFNAPLNEVTEPIQSEFGYHLILPYERREATTPPLEEVQEQVTEGAQNDVLRQLLETYQSNATVETFPELVAPAASEEAAPTDEAAPDASEDTPSEEASPSTEPATEEATPQDSNEVTPTETTPTDEAPSEETAPAEGQ